MKPFVSYLEGVLLAGLGLSIVFSCWLIMVPVLIAGFIGMVMWADLTSDYCGY
jgi:hypothetical protein